MNVKKWIFPVVLLTLAFGSTLCVSADEIEEEEAIEEIINEEDEENENNEVLEEGDSLLRELSDTENDSEVLEDDSSLENLLMMLGAELEGNEEGDSEMSGYVLQIVENTDLNRRYYDEEKDVYFSGYEFYSYKLQVYMTVLLSVLCGLLILVMFRCGGSGHGCN